MSPPETGGGQEVGEGQETLGSWRGHQSGSLPLLVLALGSFLSSLDITRVRRAVPGESPRPTLCLVGRAASRQLAPHMLVLTPCDLPSE